MTEDQVAAIQEAKLAVTAALEKCQGAADASLGRERPLLPLNASDARKLTNRLKELSSRSEAVARAYGAVDGQREGGDLVRIQISTMQELVERLKAEEYLAQKPEVNVERIQSCLREVVNGIAKEDRRNHPTNIKRQMKCELKLELDPLTIRSVAQTMPDVEVDKFGLVVPRKGGLQLKRYVARSVAWEKVGQFLLNVHPRQAWSGHFNTSELAQHLKMLRRPELERELVGHVEDFINKLLQPPRPALGFKKAAESLRGRSVIVPFEESDDKAKYDQKRKEVLGTPTAFVRDDQLVKTVIHVLAKSRDAEPLKTEDQHQEKSAEMCLDIKVCKLRIESKRLFELELHQAAFGEEYQYTTLTSALKDKLELVDEAGKLRKNKLVQDNLFEIVSTGNFEVSLRLRLLDLKRILQQGPVHISALSAKYSEAFAGNYENHALPTYMSSLLAEDTMRELAAKVPGLRLGEDGMLCLSQA